MAKGACASGRLFLYAFKATDSREALSENFYRPVKTIVKLPDIHYIDSAIKGLEGNLCRAFFRKFPIGFEQFFSAEIVDGNFYVFGDSG